MMDWVSELEEMLEYDAQGSPKLRQGIRQLIRDAIALDDSFHSNGPVRTDNLPPKLPIQKAFDRMRSTLEFLRNYVESSR